MHFNQSDFVANSNLPLPLPNLDRLRQRTNDFLDSFPGRSVHAQHGCPWPIVGDLTDMYKDIGKIHTDTTPTIRHAYPTDSSTWAD